MSFAPIVPGSFYQNPSLQYGPMLPGQDRGAPIPGWGMNPYWAGPPMVGVGGFGSSPILMPPPQGETKTMSTGAMVAIGIAVFGILGFAIYANYKVASKIAEKEGSEGLLKYELGTAAIGVGARAIDRAFERNGPRRRRGRRRSRK